MSSEQRKSYSSRAVFLGIAASMVGALAVAGYIYARYVRYEPKALAHVDPSATHVATMSVQQAVVYEPFRRHLLALLELGRDGSSERLTQLRKRTGLELGVDAREFVWAVGPGDEWTIALAGMFPQEGVVEGVKTVFEEEGVQLAFSEGVLTAPSGMAFGVADDGTLLLASSRARLLASLPVRPGQWTSSSAALGVLRDFKALGCCPGLSSAQLLVEPNQDFSSLLRVSVDEDQPRPPWGPAAARAMLAQPEEGWRWTAIPGGFRGTGRLSRASFDHAVARLAREVRAGLLGPDSR